VAEWLRRWAADSLYMGSIPIPSSNTETLQYSDITDFLLHLKKKGYKDTIIKESYSKIPMFVAIVEMFYLRKMKNKYIICF
jgi:hypothetical protein